MEPQSTRIHRSGVRCRYALEMPLGWFAEMERRRTEFREYVAHIGKMDELGLTNDSSKSDSIKTGTAPGGEPNTDMIPGKIPEMSAPVIIEEIKQ